MSAQIYAFDSSIGGGYRMAFLYPGGLERAGKSTAKADIFEGRFVGLLPDQKIVEAISFQSGTFCLMGRPNLHVRQCTVVR